MSFKNIINRSSIITLAFCFSATIGCSSSSTSNDKSITPITNESYTRGSLVSSTTLYSTGGSYITQWSVYSDDRVSKDGEHISACRLSGQPNQNKKYHFWWGRINVIYLGIDQPIGIETGFSEIERPSRLRSIHIWGISSGSDSNPIAEFTRARSSRRVSGIEWYMGWLGGDSISNLLDGILEDRAGIEYSERELWTKIDARNPLGRGGATGVSIEVELGQLNIKNRLHNSGLSEAISFMRKCIEDLDK